MLVPSVQRVVAMPPLLVGAELAESCPPPDVTRKSTLMPGTPRPLSSDLDRDRCGELSADAAGLSVAGGDRNRRGFARAGIGAVAATGEQKYGCGKRKREKVASHEKLLNDQGPFCSPTHEPASHRADRPIYLYVAHTSA